MRTRLVRPKGSRPLLEALEDQILYSADALGGLDAVLIPNNDETVLEASLLPTTGDAEDTSAQQMQVAVTHEVIFVDTDTDDYQQLVDDLTNNSGEYRQFDVFILDNTRDGVEQISEVLAGYSNLDAVHIFSHGGDGSIDLGNSRLDSDALNASAAEIGGWASAFSETGDFLIYGCNLAASADGQSFVDSLASITGADVAASDDLTGSASLGGDWDLEYHHGNIESAVALSAEAQQNWTHVLDVTVDATSTGTTEGTSLNISHTTTSASDRLMLVGVSMEEDSESVSSVTYNGQNLTFVGAEGTGGARVEIWSMIAPDSGTHNVVVNLTGSGNDATTVGVTTFEGVDQSTPLGAFVGTSGAGTSGSTTISSAAGDLVFGVVHVDDNINLNLVPDAGQTERWDVHIDDGNGGRQYHNGCCLGRPGLVVG